MNKTPGRELYERQIAYLMEKDVDNLVKNNYNEDAVLIGFDFPPVRGHEALRRQFTDYLNTLGNLTVESTDNFTETEDTVFFEATVTTSLGVLRVYDAFVLNKGKISYHFTGVIS